MESGALGCEIDIAGKLTGPRKRTEKFVAGNMLHAGNPAMELVDKGFAIAIKKLGIIGCRVRIVPPTIKLPGRFKTIEVAAPEAAREAKKEGIGELVKAPAEAKPETPMQAKAEIQAPAASVEVEPEAVTPLPETQPAQSPESEGHTGEIEERTHGDVVEHKHAGYDYWHPASRVHKKEES
jgi:small subunit ribosomal protein S3